MTVTLNLTEYSQAIRSALDDMVSALRVDLNILVENETSDLTYLRVTSAGDELTELLSFDKVEQWFSLLKNDLSMTIDIEDRDVHERITAGDRAGLEKAVHTCETYRVDGVDITLQINKDMLKATLSKLSGTEIHHVFLFEQGLIRSLNLAQVARLLADGERTPSRSTIIAVLSSPGVLQGALLNIVGMMDARPEEFTVASPPDSLLSAWNLSLALRKHTAVWTAPLAEVCPDMFQVASLRPGLELTHRALAHLCDCLAILQFCSSVAEERGRFVVRMGNFAGPNIDIADEPFVDTNAIPGLACLTPLYSVYQWAFPSESRTKIDVVRRVVRESFPNSTSVTISQLQQRRDFLHAAESTFAIVCRRAFKAYLRSREEVEGGIQQFLNATHQRITALGEEVVTTTLQFFTGALAFAVANLFQHDISNRAKQFGFALALVYVVLIVCFRLMRLYLQHKAQLKQTTTLIDGHSELLQQVLDDYKKELIQKSEGAFRGWFVAVCAFYGACAVFFAVMLYILR